MKQFSNLPHINLKNHYQFITFRTYESIDNYVKKVQNYSLKDNIKQYKIDSYLDNSLNGSYFFNEYIDIMKNVLLEHDKSLYNLVAFCIMPNHIHMLIKQIESLDTIMQRVKGKSAYILNQKLNKKGKFWANGYYDKVIRDKEQYITTIEYILNNPIKANLKDYKQRVYCIYN